MHHDNHSSQPASLAELPNSDSTPGYLPTKNRRTGLGKSITVEQETAQAPLPIGSEVNANSFSMSIGTEARLGRVQFWKDVKTSAPLLLCDAVGAALAIIVANLIGSFFFMPLSSEPAFVLGSVGFILLVQHIHGLYPACGLSYSIEFRRVLRTCLIVGAGLAVSLLMKDSSQFPFRSLLDLPNCLAVAAYFDASLHSKDLFAMAMVEPTSVGYW